jgi:hypothetical protein
MAWQSRVDCRRVVTDGGEPAIYARAVLAGLGGSGGGGDWLDGDTLCVVGGLADCVEVAAKGVALGVVAVPVALGIGELVAHAVGRNRNRTRAMIGDDGRERGVCG